MNSRRVWFLRVGALLTCILSWFVPVVRSDDNSWTNTTDGSWHDDGNWSLGVAPSDTQSAIWINNADTKTVTINATTAASYPGTLTISNLNLWADSGATNTLFLNDAGQGVPLHVLDGLGIGGGGVLVVTNSALRVDGVSGSGYFNLDNGEVKLLDGADLLATNLATVIGFSGGGSLLLDGGKMLVRETVVGQDDGSQGLLTVARGTNQITSFLFIGGNPGATGTVWLTDGLLVVTNDVTRIGEQGVGQMTVSNGTWLAGEVDVGNISGAQGTLTVVGGTNEILSAVFVAFNAGSTGSVSLSGGTLIVTNDRIVVAREGVGQMTIAGDAEVDAQAFGIGEQPGASGTLTVNGGGLHVAQVLQTAIGGHGLMIVSNGLVETPGLNVSQVDGSDSELILAGGTIDLAAQPMLVATDSGSTGRVWVTDGHLMVENDNILVGASGLGTMTVSNGLVEALGLQVGQASNAVGTFTMAGGTATFSSWPVIIGDNAGATGTVWMTGGHLAVVSDQIVVAASGVGTMAISNGQVEAAGIRVGQMAGSAGTFTMAGGEMDLSGSWLSVGSEAGATGTVWVSGGTLSMPNPQQYIGDSGVGRMTVSNGTVIAQSVIVGLHTNAQGKLTIAGGTTTLPSFLGVGWDTNAIGQLSVSGGQLTCSNLYAGYYGNGTITISGGNVPLTGFLSIGRQVGSSGTFWLTGGTLTSANYGLDSRIGRDGVGQVTVSNGTLAVPALSVGYSGGARGTLTINGGNVSAWSNLTIGVAGCGATGIVTVAGGNIYVTNSSVNATLEVRSGTLTFSSGLLSVDRFVMTNACGHFVRTGGTLLYGSAVLDAARDDDNDGMANGWELDYALNPLDAADAGRDKDGDGFTNLQEFLAGTDPTNSASAFRITAVAREGGNIRITWMTGIGKTNALQFTSGASYNTNFTAIFTVTNSVSSVTNYLDSGAATNFPARYYRVRLVP